jgi:uncharacterized protein
MVDTSSEAMEDLVRYIAGSLVSSPDLIGVRSNRFGNNIEVRLTVAPEEMGKVIGRQGKIARAIRAVLAASAAKQGVRVSLDIDD